MEEEIDLRKYIELLLDHWLWIVGLTVVAAIAAFVFSTLQAPTYEASAVVLVTEPRFQLQFDSRFRTDAGAPAYKAFPTLATSDSVLQNVVDAYAEEAQPSSSPLTRHDLSNMVEASSEGDPSLVVLTVRSESARFAATIANLWAETFARRGNQMYSGGAQDVDFFESQLSSAGAMLDKAEADLVEFEARNQRSILDAQLTSKLQAQQDYLTSQRTIEYIIQDVQALHAQLVDQPGDQPTSLADGLTALLLQTKAFNAQSEMPIQLQINSAGALSMRTIAEQVALLTDLVTTLQAKSAEIDRQLTNLEPEIMILQQKLQQAENERDRLIRDRDLTRETSLTLARKLEEAQISAQEANGVLHVGSQASVPVKPVGPRKLLNTVIAGMLGFMVAVVAVFAVGFWTEGNERSPSSEG